MDRKAVKKKVQKVHFYLDKQKNPNAKEKIFLVSNFYGNRLKLDTGEIIEPNLWNKDLQRCKEGNELTERQNRETKKINKRLNQIIEICDREYKNNYNYFYNKKDWEVFVERFKWTIKYSIDKKDKQEKEEQEKKEITPLEYFEKYIREMNKIVNKKTHTFIGEGTKGHHTLVYKRIKEYIETHHQSNSFNLFNEKFEKDFEVWGLQTKNYSPNTIVASFSVLKVWLNNAEKEGLITDKSFHSYKSKGSTSEEISLTDDEIKRIHKVDIAAEKAKGNIDEKLQIEITKDLFIISCLTGLRFSDLKQLNSKAIWSMKEGEETLIMQTQKTAKPIEVPLHPYCIALYKKYDGIFPKPLDKSKAINHLKKLGEMAQINDEIQISKNRGGKIITTKYKKFEQIKNHTGRRSFCTNLYLKGMPTIAIMQMSGHSTEENFLKYIKVGNKENANGSNLNQSLMTSMSIEALQFQLMNGTSHFIYRKKDGSLREAFGTLLEKVVERNTNGLGYIYYKLNIYHRRNQQFLSEKGYHKKDRY